MIIELQDGEGIRLRRLNLSTPLPFIFQAWLPPGIGFLAPPDELEELEYVRFLPFCQADYGKVVYRSQKALGLREDALERR